MIVTIPKSYGMGSPWQLNGFTHVKGLEQHLTQNKGILNMVTIIINWAPSHHVNCWPCLGGDLVKRPKSSLKEPLRGTNWGHSWIHSESDHNLSATIWEYPSTFHKPQPVPPSNWGPSVLKASASIELICICLQIPCTGWTGRQWIFPLFFLFSLKTTKKNLN